MARATNKQQVKPLAELASRIAARWGGAGGELALDRLVSELGDVQRYDIVAALKELEKAGAGTFEVGRAGRKARFLWSGKKLALDRSGAKDKAKPVEKTSVKAKRAPEDAGRLELSQRVKLAARRPAAVQPRSLSAREQDLEARAEPTPSGDLEHRFHLRPGFVASVRLPVDVSSSEVARFCQFLQAIPFGNGR